MSKRHIVENHMPRLVWIFIVVGDAILAIWRVGRVEELQAELAKVVACCLGIQEECGEWSTDIGVKLTVKIGKKRTNTFFTQETNVSIFFKLKLKSYAR